MVADHANVIAVTRGQLLVGFAGFIALDEILEQDGGVLANLQLDLLQAHLVLPQVEVADALTGITGELHALELKTHALIGGQG